ncbi:MAG: carboxypeptidase-like regulatory domain-containing protein [Chitinophagaceae bacterium]
MGKPVQLHIPEPCHEKWSNMTPVEKGRFCGSCQKEVVDFTSMNDEQVLAFFKRQTTGSVCGRFMQDQLDRSMQMPKKRIPWVKYFFQFALPAFLLSTKASAQGKVRVLTGDTIVVPVTEKIDTAQKVVIPEHNTNEKVIRGKVVDENDNGIPYASILIKGTTNATAADSTGHFSLKYNEKGDSCVLTSSCIGFREAETTIDLNSEGGPVVIPMTSTNAREEVVFMGMVSREIDKPLLIEDVDTTTAPDMVTKNIFDTVWNKIFKLNVPPQIYPNPLKRGETLTIEMKKHEKGNYLFQLSTTNGQVMLNKELWIDEYNRVVKINIPPVAAGTYFLQIINKQSGKRDTEKIIIE